MGFLLHVTMIDQRLNPNGSNGEIVDKIEKTRIFPWLFPVVFSGRRFDVGLYGTP